MRTVRDAKSMAKALRAELAARRQVDLSHSECLEIVARQFGLDNWNILVAMIAARPDEAAGPLPWRTPFAQATTIPVVPVSAVDRALEFYVDFLGLTLNFGGPAHGPGTPFYGQVSGPGTTLHLAEQPPVAGAGVRVGIRVGIWLTGLDDLRDRLVRLVRLVRHGEVPEVPEIEEAPWAARLLPLTDPFGNELWFNEPVDATAQAHLPRWENPVAVHE